MSNTINTIQQISEEDKINFLRKNGFEVRLNPVVLVPFNFIETGGNPNGDPKKEVDLHDFFYYVIEQRILSFVK